MRKICWGALFTVHIEGKKIHFACVRVRNCAALITWPVFCYLVKCARKATIARRPSDWT